MFFFFIFKALTALLTLTFLCPGKYGDDLAARLSLLRHRWQWLGAVVRRERVFTGAGAEDSAAHADRRGGGFVLGVAVVAHRSRTRLFVLFSQEMTRRVWGGRRGRTGRQTEREDHISMKHTCAHASPQDVQAGEEGRTIPRKKNKTINGYTGDTCSQRNNLVLLK